MGLRIVGAMMAALILLVAIVRSSNPALAQSDLSVAVLNVDDSAFPQVTASVVVDYRGRPAQTIAPVDVDVQESGAPAALLSIRRAVDENVPLALVLAIDVSGSMEGEPLDKAKASAVSLLASLAPADLAAVVSFGEAVRVEQGLTHDRSALVDAVSRLHAEGSTPLYDAVAESAQIGASSGLIRKAVVLLSDGKESGEGPRRSREESLRLASEAKATFYVVGVGTDVDRAYLEELATRTRGRFFEAFGSAQIPSIYAGLEELLRAHLVLVFRATSARDLPDRSLKVAVVQEGAAASAELAYRSLRAAGPGGGPPPVMLFAGLAVAAAVVGVIVMRRSRRDDSALVPEQGSEELLVRGVVAKVPTQASLAVVAGPTSEYGPLLRVDEHPATIGSDVSCALHLDHPVGVASKHARVWLRNGKVMLHHLARTERTFVGGKQVSWAALDEGEEVTIGPYVLRYVGAAA